MNDNRFRNILFIALTQFLFIATALGLVGLFFLINLPFSNTSAVLNVSGQGKVVSRPDLAEVGIAVITQGATPTQVQKENDEKVQAVVDYLKEKGVKEEDLKTVSYNLYPEYRQEETGVFDKERGRTIIGYTLHQSLNFKVRELNRVGEILAGLSERGVNNIEGITFGLSEEKRETLRAQAREEAIKKAQLEFERLRRQLGFKKFQLIEIQETGGSPLPIYSDRVFLAKEGENLASPVEPGTAEIVINVNLSYRVR